MVAVSISPLTIFMGIGLVVGIGLLSWLVLGSKNNPRL